MIDNNEDLGRANASGLDGIEFLINDLKVGGVIDFNGKKIRFDDEANLMNFKLGLVLGATIANKPINLADNSKLPNATQLKLSPMPRQDYALVM